MKKSIYSLVLADEVVAAVDRMAYEMHTSRSNLINQLLAERLSCTTPEMRMRAVFSGMETLEQQFRVLEQTSAHLLTLQSRLEYKYNPTVRYFVELYRTPQDGDAGRLRVQLRTQNAGLLAATDAFFKLWMLLEKKYLPGTHTVVYQLAPGKLIRSIRDPGVDEEIFGMLLRDYVSRFDRYLKAWFAGGDSPGRTSSQLEETFRQEADTMEQVI